jgi:PilZ domain
MNNYLAAFPTLGGPAPKTACEILQQRAVDTFIHFPTPRLAVSSAPSYNTPPCEAPMPFTLRLYQRFPVYCSASYHAGLFQGQGTVWNFSLSGWKLSGDVPLQVGQMCSLTVNLPIEESIVVDAAIVRWVRGQEFGLETLAIEKQTHSRVEHVIKRLVEESGENIE